MHETAIYRRLENLELFMYSATSMLLEATDGNVSKILNQMNPARATPRSRQLLEELAASLGADEKPEADHTPDTSTLEMKNTPEPEPAKTPEEPQEAFCSATHTHARAAQENNVHEAATEREPQKRNADPQQTRNPFPLADQVSQIAAIVECLRITIEGVLHSAPITENEVYGAQLVLDNIADRLCAIDDYLTNDKQNN
jgi:hypothetical protein